MATVVVGHGVASNRAGPERPILENTARIRRATWRGPLLPTGMAIRKLGTTYSSTSAVAVASRRPRSETRTASARDGPAGRAVGEVRRWVMAWTGGEEHAISDNAGVVLEEKQRAKEITDGCVCKCVCVCGEGVDVFLLGHRPSRPAPPCFAHKALPCAQLLPLTQ